MRVTDYELSNLILRLEKEEDFKTIVSALRDLVDLRIRHMEVESALERSLKLQSHYAELLNMWDGGKRIGFKSAQEWIERLRVVRQQEDEIINQQKE